MSLEIEATDVVKIILQFCKENGLTESFHALQNECQVSLNTVDSVEAFAGDITAGRWDALLPVVAQLKLPRRKLEDLYEHVVLEMVELREIDTARAMLRQTQVLTRMKVDDPERWARLEALCGKTYLDAHDLYGATSKDKRRGALAAALTAEVAVVPPSRLMALIGQALKWQQAQGLLPPGAALDLFRGAAASARDEVEAFPTQLAAKVVMGPKAHAEVAAFSPDGASLVTGSVDGFIEVWDPATGKLRRDLPYQAEEAFMVHDDAVLALAFSRDGELLASGSQGGQVKVWRVRSGQCLRRFDTAHAQGVTSVAWSRDGTQVLSASFDGTARVHGLKSGRLLKEFRGHSSYVNGACYTADGAGVVTCSSDGTVRVWDARSCEQLHAFKPPAAVAGGADPAVVAALPHPLQPDRLIVADRGPTAYLTTLQGQVVSSFHTGLGAAAGKAGAAAGGAAGSGGGGSGGAGGGAGGADGGGGGGGAGGVLAVAPSPRGEWLYALGTDGAVYCFSCGGKGGAGAGAGTGAGGAGGAGGGTGGEPRLEHILPAHAKGAIGLAHHPHRNVLATYASEGPLLLWKA